MKSSAPSPPDPVATANAQSTSNVNTAAATAALNDINQYTPYGATTYQQTGSYTTPSGETVPRYTQYTQLSPLGQSIFTGEQSIGNNLVTGAQPLTTRAIEAASTPLNFNTPYTSTLNQGPQLLNQNTTNAIYGQQKSFLDPQWNQQQAQLEDQLSRQGIPVGSDAYKNAMQQFNNSKTQAYQSAQDSAISGGTAAAGNLFNLALAGQQQNLQQQQLGQTNPLEMMSNLLRGAPTTQSQPIVTPTQASISPTDVIGSTGLSTNAAMNAYQAQLQNQNATMGGLSSLGSAALLALAL